MAGRTVVASATGKERDTNLIRINFNMAKEIGRVRFGKDFIFYRSMDRWLYVEYNEMVWVYRRQEDVEGKLGTGGTKSGLHTIMVVTKEGKRFGIAVEGEENAVSGLKFLEEKNRFIDVGYTKEKESRYMRSGDSFR